MKFITTDDFSTYPGIIFLCLIGSGHNVTNVGKRILLNEIDLCLLMMKHDAIYTACTLYDKSNSIQKLLFVDKTLAL